MIIKSIEANHYIYERLNSLMKDNNIKAEEEIPLQQYPSFCIRVSKEGTMFYIAVKDGVGKTSGGIYLTQTREDGENFLAG